MAARKSVAPLVIFQAVLIVPAKDEAFVTSERFKMFSNLVWKGFAAVALNVGASKTA